MERAEERRRRERDIVRGEREEFSVSWTLPSSESLYSSTVFTMVKSCYYSITIQTVKKIVPEDNSIGYLACQSISRARHQLYFSHSFWRDTGWPVSC